MAMYLLCALLGLCLPLCHEPAESWFTKGAQIVAKYSYAIYLFHIPIIYVAFMKLSYAPLVLQIAVFIVLIVLVPWLAYQVIEHPLIKLGQRLATRISSVSFSTARLQAG
jgi:peptidoglycan/LPS O-acetylase OafA/YrhL